MKGAALTLCICSMQTHGLQTLKKFLALWIVQKHLVSATCIVPATNQMLYICPNSPLDLSVLSKVFFFHLVPWSSQILLLWISSQLCPLHQKLNYLPSLNSQTICTCQSPVSMLCLCCWYSELQYQLPDSCHLLNWTSVWLLHLLLFHTIFRQVPSLLIHNTIITTLMPMCPHLLATTNLHTITQHTTCQLSPLQMQTMFICRRKRSHTLFRKWSINLWTSVTVVELLRPQNGAGAPMACARYAMRVDFSMPSLSSVKVLCWQLKKCSTIRYVKERMAAVYPSRNRLWMSPRSVCVRHRWRRFHLFLILHHQWLELLNIILLWLVLNLHFHRFLFRQCRALNTCTMYNQKWDPCPCQDWRNGAIGWLYHALCWTVLTNHCLHSETETILYGI